MVVKFKQGDMVDDKYEIEAVLAETSTSIVYKAKEKNLGRLVALKTPKPEFLQIREFASRFRREGKLLAQLNHANVVQLLGMGSAGDSVYMALEYFEGVELASFMKAPPPGTKVGDILTILSRASEALAHCHERGVIHRDARPENLLVTPLSRGGHRVKLIDFDLARLENEKQAGPDETEEVTKMNATIGTPSYLSPEQAQGEKVTIQSDIYSLACVYYYCFTLEFVFTGSVFSVISQHVKKEPDSPTLRNPRLPTEFSKVILRGLAKNPADRWPTAMEMSRAVMSAMRPLAEKPFAELVPSAAPPAAPGFPRSSSREGSSPFPRRSSRETAAPSFGGSSTREMPMPPGAGAGPGFPGRRKSRETPAPGGAPAFARRASREAMPAIGGAAKPAETRDPALVSRQQGKASAKALLTRIAQNSLKNIPILAPTFNLPAYIEKACNETGRDVDMSTAEQAWVLRLLSEEEIVEAVDNVLKTLKATQSMARMPAHDKQEFRRLLLQMPTNPSLFPEGGRRR